MKHTRLYRSVLVLLAGLMLPLLGRAAELVVNPNDPAAWKLEVAGGAAATLRQDQGALRVDITTPSSDWHVQIYQRGKAVRSGTTCTLRFSAKASAKRGVRINSQVDASPWRMVLARMPMFDLTPQWQSYTFELTFADSGTEQLRVPMFLLGDMAGTVWIKDVSVTGPGDAVRSTPSPAVSGAVAPPPGAPVAPASPASPTAPASPQAPAGNLLANPMEVSNWSFEAVNGAQATFRSEEGMLRVDVSTAGGEARQVQLYQMPQALAAGKMYFLTISVRASAPRKLSFTALQGWSGEAILPVTPLNIGPEWKQYKLRFTLRQFAPGQTRMPVLQLGDAAGTVFFRSIALVEAGE